MNRIGAKADDFRLSRLDASRFGVKLEFESADIETIVEICSANTESILRAFYAARGLLLIKGLDQIRGHPRALVELSRLFGPEVENYRQTLTSPRFFHASEPEILILSNDPPCNHPPPPRPGHKSGNNPGLPVRFPQQLNWHSDQSYRRPPPDISLLLALELPPRNQGQTLFADCNAALAALCPRLRRGLGNLQGIHAPAWVGRSRAAVKNGEPALELLPHQLPQRHPLLRRHPVSGELALFICEEQQMDYVDGPVAGLEPGADGAGARLIRKLLKHATREEFVYTHEWEVGDLLVGDNRNLLHCATWYDAERYSRLMWRTTVMGNPGAEYRGEQNSWTPLDGSAVMAGMEHA